MPTTPNGIRYPQGSDSADIPLHFQNLASDVDTKFIPITYSDSGVDIHLHRTGLGADLGNWMWYIGNSGEVQFATETDAHAATNRASIQRDGQVRANASTPVAAADLTRKDYVDGQISALATTDVLTATSPWSDYGGVFAGLYITRMGDIVTVQGLFKVNASGLTVAAGSAYNLASIPVGFRPSAQIIDIAGCSNNGASQLTHYLRLDYTTAGVLQFVPNAAFTFTASAGWIAVNTSYRGA
jgi:hypothetical protein